MRMPNGATSTASASAAAGKFGKIGIRAVVQGVDKPDNAALDEAYVPVRHMHISCVHPHQYGDEPSI